MIDDMAVYIANLGKYNEGYLVGAWFTFPIDEEDVKEKIGLNEQYEEYAIYDSENFPCELEEYTALLTVYENLEALYICRNVITVYPDCKSMIDVARQKLMNDPTFKHLSEDCQEYYFDFEAYASHLQEHGKFLVTEHGIFELPE